MGICLLRGGGSIPSISVGMLRVAPAAFQLECCVWRRHMHSHSLLNRVEIVGRVANSSPKYESPEQMVYSIWCTSVSVTPVDDIFKSFSYTLEQPVPCPRNLLIA